MTSAKMGEQSQFHGDPLVTDDLVIIGTDGTIGHVYAFDRATGAVRWKYKVEATGVASDIVRLERQIYFVTIANDLVCLELQSGKPKWVFHDAYSPREHCVTCASPAVSDGRAYFGGADGFAYAVEAQSGKLIWKKDLGAQVTTSAAVDHHNLYLGTSKRHLYRLDTDSGTVLSDLPTESAPNRRLIVAKDSLLAFLGDEIFASLDLDLKKLQWSAEATKQWTSARPYLWHDAVLVGNRRELVALRSSDGTREWSFQFPETVRASGRRPISSMSARWRVLSLHTLPNLKNEGQLGYENTLGKNLHDQDPGTGELVSPPSGNVPCAHRTSGNPSISGNH